MLLSRARAPLVFLLKQEDRLEKVENYKLFNILRHSVERITTHSVLSISR